jgi:hypothetical protein
LAVASERANLPVPRSDPGFGLVRSEYPAKVDPGRGIERVEFLGYLHGGRSDTLVAIAN